MRSKRLKKKEIGKKQIVKNKGITLIALVITIIVLLILAGVSIATLTGENGILTQASKAGEKTKMADAQEQVQLAVMGSYNDKGKIDIDEKLNENLSNIEGLTYHEKKIEPKGENKIENLPDIVNVDGYDILIQDDGTADLVSKDVVTANKETPNGPVMLSGMKKIMFTEPTDDVKGEVIREGDNNFQNDNWYNYTEKRWANVETADGSMWVWIPRYAYKVNEENHTFDIKFLIGTTDYYYDENGELKKAERITSKEDTADTKNKYYTHPAFTDESDEKIEYTNGGWDKELKGIWVAKFEAGYAGGNNSVSEAVSTKETYSQTDAYVRGAERGAADDYDTARNWLDGIYGANPTEIKYPVFMGTTYSINYINHNDVFLVAKKISASGNPYKLPTTADSHLMKDSEWGAVAYLGQSKYGLGSKEVYINNVTLNSGSAKRTATTGKSGVDSVYAVTGLTSETVVKGTSEEQNNIGTNSQALIDQINNVEGDTPTEIGKVYTWQQKSGQGASSTGTIYGIYDLSGGVWERTAAYTANGNGNLTSFGKSLLYNGSPTEEKSTKYVTVYAHNPEYDKNGEDRDTANSENYKLEANKRKFGNAMHEISTSGIGSTSWRGDYSYFVGLDYPLSIHGGNYFNSSVAGLFSFARTEGGSTFNYRVPCGLGWYVAL